MMISRAFEKAKHTYDKEAVIQRKIAENLVSSTSQFLPKGRHRFLDVGTGTGFMPVFLQSIYPDAKFYLNDLSKGMLDTATQKLNASQIVGMFVGDASVLQFDTTPFTLITANMVPQWFEDIPKGLGNLLNQTQFLAFSMPVTGTFVEWENLLIQQGRKSRLQPFIDSDHLRQELQVIYPGLSIHSWDIHMEPLHFSNLLDFVRHLKRIGAQTPSHLNSAEDLSFLRSLSYPFTTQYTILSAIVSAHT